MLKKKISHKGPVHLTYWNAVTTPSKNVEELQNKFAGQTERFFEESFEKNFRGLKNFLQKGKKKVIVIGTGKGMVGQSQKAYAEYLQKVHSLLNVTATPVYHVGFTKMGTTVHPSYYMRSNNDMIEKISTENLPKKTNSANILFVQKGIVIKVIITKFFLKLLFIILKP